MSESTSNFPPLTAQPTPVLSLRDVVVYPHMVIPLFVGRVTEKISPNSR